MDTQWRTYRIRTAYGVESFYAPSLESAFSLARARWPYAKAWECLGSKQGSP